MTIIKTTERCICGHTRHSHKSWNGVCDKHETCGCMKFRHASHELVDHIFLLGAPCTGKTTIANALANKAEYDLISSGDVARRLGEQYEDIKEALNKGELASEELMNTAMLATLLDRKNKSIILDGYPRYWEQMCDILRFLPQPQYFIIIVTSISNRINRENKRGYDAIYHDRRMSVFYKRTIPIIKWLINKHTVLKIDNQDNTQIDDHVASILKYIKDDGV